MIKYDLHTHTIYSDGNNTIEEMVLAAEKKGIEILGISDHEYAPMQTSFCISKEKTEGYIEKINKLKANSPVKLYLGTERDYFSTETEYEYDYIIGSVHSIFKNGEYIDVDYSEKVMVENVDRLYNGDYLEYISDYYSLVKDIVNKTNCDIVGHFDLVCKFNEGNKYFDETSDEYIAIVLDAAKEIAKSGKYVEINTGAMHRGYRTRQYPDKFWIDYFKSQDIKLILSSDSHSTDTLCYQFENMKKYIDK